MNLTEQELVPEIQYEQALMDAIQTNKEFNATDDDEIEKTIIKKNGDANFRKGKINS